MCVSLVGSVIWALVRDECRTQTGEIGREVREWSEDWNGGGGSVDLIPVAGCVDLGVRTVPLWLPNPDSDDFPLLASNCLEALQIEWVKAGDIR
jgi:hypothetical protein